MELTMVRAQMWNKRLLLFLWSIEMIWLFVAAVISGYNSMYPYTNEDGKILFDWYPGTEFWLPFSAAFLMLDITDAVRLIEKTLQPNSFLAYQVIKACFWFAIFIMDLTIIPNGGAGVHLLFSVVLLITSTGLTAYGALVVHRRRTGLFKTPEGSTHELPGRNPFRDPSRQNSPAGSGQPGSEPA